MSGDFSRDTFRPGGDYTFVRMQQGRLLTDADWNEQGDILRDTLRETATDLVGQSGFPEDNAGFALLPAGVGNGVAISPGEAYVDGIRVVLAERRLGLTRSSGTGAATQWQLERGPRVAPGDLLLLPGQPLANAARVGELLPDANGKQIFKCVSAISPNNNVEVLRFQTVDSQPFLPPPQLPTQAGDYVAYLDVWERPIGAIEDPLIRETAFGGPDTAMRDQLVWQVRFARLSDLAAVGAVTLPASCKSFGPGWTPLGIATAPGAMAAKAEAAGAATNPCVLPSTGGYRSLENRLYRVEIHNGGRTQDNKVTVKWSRDNAIHRTRYVVDNNALLVDSLGRDDEGSLAIDNWVEILDEGRSLAGLPGFLARISDVNGNRVSLGEIVKPEDVTAAATFAQLPVQGLVRRWEGGVAQKVTANSWIKLENGVEILFAPGRYSTQDYWTIPARTVTADIEWPRDPASGLPQLLPPKGVRHHYCALALANFTGTSWTLTDCRDLFAPLTRQRGFHYLGGDGQEAMPNPLAPAALIPLAAELRVGYVRGRTPVVGANVRFTILSGAGRFANAAPAQTVQTVADGVAKVAWSVDAVTPVQQVIAELLDSQNQRIHLPIVFTANLSTAAKTSFDPASVPVLAGANTVQGAIEKLAGMQQTGCSTRIVVEGSDWVSTLKSLKPGEDASICFQRGTYETQETVTLANLGHVSLSGAGAGTRIVGKRRECALEFTGCASVTVHDVDISTPDGTGAVENLQRRNGSLTIAECGAADVHDVSLSCGAGVAAERTCLTVRGKVAGGTGSVRIRGNRITAGYAQDGILVTDCVRGVVEGNELSVAPRPGSLSVDKLLEGKEWRARLVDILVARPEIEAVEAGGNDKAIRGGDFVVTFESAVSQREWDLLVIGDPPQAADVKTEATFGAYASRIVDKALTQEHMPASHKKRTERLIKQTGRPAFDALNEGIKRGLLVNSDLTTRRLDDKMNRKGAIILTQNAQRILFDSPVSQADWTKAMTLMPPKQINRPNDLIGHAQAMAGRMVTDVAFRTNLPSAVKWHAQYVKDLPTFGRQAITCGGKILGDICVRGNRTEGFIQGVHVGASERGLGSKSIAGIVAIEANSLLLRLPGDGVYASCGLFVGNADTVRIESNVLAWSVTRGARETRFAQGIRVWGYLGRFLLIGANRIATASLGIRVRPIEMVSANDSPKYLWLASDNLVEGVASNLVMRVPPFMTRRNNRPA